MFIYIDYRDWSMGLLVNSSREANTPVVVLKQLKHRNGMTIHCLEIQRNRATIQLKAYLWQSEYLSRRL